jgi:hypothetical protein
MHRPDPQLGKGYFTFAQNSPTVDYLNIAYLQALSIKATQKINDYAVAVDTETAKLVTDEHREVFDHVIVMDDDDAKDEEWKLENEWKAWLLTPFKETIKLDSDILFTQNIDHWWNILQQKDICCTVNIRDIENNISTVDKYRRLFKLNNLPNVYSGFTYFRYTKLSMDFFGYVHAVFKHWPLFRDALLKDCRHDKANTDEAYAIAAMLVGEENCYNPASDVPSFVHMKGAIQGWPDVDWIEYAYAQVDDNANLTVGFNRQLYPFHYVNKEFATGELIEQYKRICKSME